MGKRFVWSKEERAEYKVEALAMYNSPAYTGTLLNALIYLLDQDPSMTKMPSAQDVPWLHPKHSSDCSLSDLKPGELKDLTTVKLPHTLLMNTRENQAAVKPPTRFSK